MTSANNPSTTSLGSSGSGSAYASMQGATESSTGMCFGQDLDDLFAYNTVKIVRVRDRRLGIVRLIFILAILGYIIGDVFIIKRKFLDVETPVGTVSVSLQKPNITTDVTTFPYCLRYDDSNGPALPREFQRTCRIRDVFAIEGVPDSGDQFFIATRHSTKRERRECTPDAERCVRPWVEERGSDYHPAGTGGGQKHPDFNSTYYADIESYTLLIKHAMVAQRMFRATDSNIYSRANNAMSGKLVTRGGHVIKDFGQKPDIVKVGEILQAAGVNLDKPGKQISKTETMRHSGIVVMVTLSYSNLYDLGNPTYTMSAVRVRAAEYKVETLVEPPEVVLVGEQRTINNRHGIKLVFLQTGQMARFDFQVFLVQVVSAMALLSVATLCVELLMLYVLPQRQQYQEYKYQISEDFSDHRDRQAAPTDDVQVMHT